MSDWSDDPTPIPTDVGITPRLAALRDGVAPEENRTAAVRRERIAAMQRELADTAELIAELKVASRHLESAPCTPVTIRTARGILAGSITVAQRHCDQLRADLGVLEHA